MLLGYYHVIGHPAKSDLQISCNPNEHLNDILPKYRKPKTADAILIQKNNARDITMPDLKLCMEP